MTKNTTTKRARRRSRRNEGTIVRVGPNLVRAQVSLGIDRATGKRVRWSAYAPTEIEARRKRASFLAQKHQTPTTGSRGLTLGAWLDLWIERVKDNPGTHHYRLDKIRPVKLHLGHKRIHDLQRKDVDQLINVTLLAPRTAGGQPLAPSTRSHVRAVLRAALNDACEDDDVMLDRNVTKGVKVKGFRDDFMPRILSSRECIAFLDASKNKDVERIADRTPKNMDSLVMHALWVLALELGLREGELLGLQWAHVDLTDARLSVYQQVQRVRGGGSRLGKTRGDGTNMEIRPLKTRLSRRVLPLNPACVSALTAHRAHHTALRRKLGGSWNPLDLVFPTISGLPMQGTALRELYFQPVCESAGIQSRDGAHPDGFRIHDARHTAATNLLVELKSLLGVQRMLGHSTVKMTERYVHLLPVNIQREIA